MALFSTSLPPLGCCLEGHRSTLRFSRAGRARHRGRQVLDSRWGCGCFRWHCDSCGNDDGGKKSGITISLSPPTVRHAFEREVGDVVLHGDAVATMPADGQVRLYWCKACIFYEIGDRILNCLVLDAAGYLFGIGWHGSHVLFVWRGLDALSAVKSESFAREK